MIVVDVRLHFVVSNFENGHLSIVMSMIYVRFFRTRAFSLVTQFADGCCAAMLPPLSLGASSLINKEKFFHFLQPAHRTQGRCRIGMTAWSRDEFLAPLGRLFQKQPNRIGQLNYRPHDVWLLLLTRLQPSVTWPWSVRQNWSISWLLLMWDFILSFRTLRMDTYWLSCQWYMSYFPHSSFQQALETRSPLFVIGVVSCT